MKQLFSLTASLLLCFFAVTSAYSQGNLLHSFSSDFSILNQTETQNLQRVQASDLYETFTLTGLNDLSAILQDGKIKITIPNESCGEVTFETKSIEYQSGSNYTWYGAMQPKDLCDCSDGEAMLYRKGSKTFGYFHIGENYYTLEPLSESRHILGKNLPVQGECGTGDPNELLPSSADDRGVNCIIRVLVLLTERAKDRIGDDYEGKVTMQLARSNQVLTNSGIDPSAFKWVFVGIEVVPMSVIDEVNNNVPKIRNLIDGSFPPWVTSSPLMDLAEEYAADVFVVFVDFSALTILSGPSATTGHRGSVLASGHLNDPYTVEHEMGHLVGANHELCNAAFHGIRCIPNPPTPGYPPLPARAHAFYKDNCPGNDNKRRTVVYSQLLEDGQILPNYSNPAVFYQGQPLGVAGSVDNAQVMRNESCDVANYYNGDLTGVFYIHLTGPNILCEGSNESYGATITGDNGPYTFAWRISTDGGLTFGAVLSTTSWVDYDVPNPFNHPYVVIKVEATNTQTSVTKESYKTVPVYGYYEHPACFEWKPLNAPENFFKFELAVSPNPSVAGSDISVTIHTAKAQGVRLALTDNLGILVAEQNQMILDSIQQSTTISMPMHNIPAGCYFLTAFANEVGVGTAKVILLK